MSHRLLVIGQKNRRLFVCYQYDVLELPVETAEVRNEGCFGAALCAGVAASVYPSLKEAIHKVRAGAVYTPQCSYEHKYRLFKKKIEESYAGNA
jgi:glycerol kinase